MFNFLLNDLKKKTTTLPTENNQFFQLCKYEYKCFILDNIKFLMCCLDLKHLMFKIPKYVQNQKDLNLKLVVVLITIVLLVLCCWDALLVPQKKCFYVVNVLVFVLLLLFALILLKKHYSLLCWLPESVVVEIRCCCVDYLYLPKKT